MKLHARHTVGFLHLAALELHRISAEQAVKDNPDELAPRLRMIARKLEEEAVTLQAALAPKEEKNAQDRRTAVRPGDAGAAE